MWHDITINKDLDLPEKGVALAEIIFDVAKECDNTHSFERSIDLNGFVDKLSLQLEIFRVRHENPHFTEDEIQTLIDTIIAEDKRKKEALAAAKAAKREKIKQYIHGSALEGYDLAYNICKNEHSEEGKVLAYRMLSQLKYLPIEERIEICRLYADSLINNGESGNNIAEVYCRMAGLVYPVYKRNDYSKCLSFYEKAYEYIDKPTRMLDEIIGFCNSFGITELRSKCEQKKEHLSLSSKICEILSE